MQKKKRLSQKAWNNVLIFIALGMILVLNLDQFKQNDDNATRLIVPEGSFIQKLDINGVLIEKAAQQWRINTAGILPETMPDAQQLSSMVKAWQQVYITPSEMDFSIDSFGDPDIVVTITIAGQVESIVVGLSVQSKQLYVILNTQIYLLNSPPIKTLLEPIVAVSQ